MAAVPRDEAEARTAAWGERHKANPSDPMAAVNYAQALRASGQWSQAVAVLEQAALSNPKNTEVLGALAAANVAYLRQMLAQQNQLQVPVAKPSKTGRN